MKRLLALALVLCATFAGLLAMRAERLAAAASASMAAAVMLPAQADHRDPDAGDPESVPAVALPSARRRVADQPVAQPRQHPPLEGRPFSSCHRMAR